MGVRCATFQFFTDSRLSFLCQLFSLQPFDAPQSHYSILVTIFSSVGVLFRKSLPMLLSWNVCPCFLEKPNTLSSSLKVTLRSLIYLELIFEQGKRGGSSCIWTYGFSSFLLKRSFFFFYNECFDTSFKNWAAPAVWVYSWVLRPGETEETWFWCQPRVGSSTGDSSRADALTSRREAKTVTLAHLTLDLGHRWKMSLAFEKGPSPQLIFLGNTLDDPPNGYVCFLVHLGLIQVDKQD